MPAFPFTRPTLSFALTLATASISTAAEPLRIDISRDTWISAYPSEVEGSNGASPKMKFKGCLLYTSRCV